MRRENQGQIETFFSPVDKFARVLVIVPEEKDERFVLFTGSCAGGGWHETNGKFLEAVHYLHDDRVLLQRTTTTMIK